MTQAPRQEPGQRGIDREVQTHCCGQVLPDRGRCRGGGNDGRRLPGSLRRYCRPLTGHVRPPTICCPHLLSTPGGQTVVCLSIDFVFVICLTKADDRILHGIRRACTGHVRAPNTYHLHLLSVFFECASYLHDGSRLPGDPW